MPGDGGNIKTGGPAGDEGGLQGECRRIGKQLSQAMSVRSGWRPGEAPGNNAYEDIREEKQFCHYRPGFTGRKYAPSEPEVTAPAAVYQEADFISLF